MDAGTVALSPAERECCADALDRADAAAVPIALPEAIRRASRADALDIALRLEARVQARLGGAVIGAKIGGTTEAALARLGLAGPWTGPLFSARCHASGVRLPRARFNVCIVECEIAVRLAHDLGDAGRLSRAALVASIDRVAPAIELADTRYADWTTSPASGFIADMGFAGHWVRGADSADVGGFDWLGVPARLRRDGQVVSEGSGALILGDPLCALALAAHDRRSQGRPFRAGDWISLGSCSVPLPLAGGGVLEADFGPFGQVRAELT